MERLLGTNSELGNKVNSQAARISSLEAAVEEAHASRSASPAVSEPAGRNAWHPPASELGVSHHDIILDEMNVRESERKPLYVSVGHLGCS